MFEFLDAIEKSGTPKIIDTKNLLGSNQTKEVATIGSTMTIIKDFFSLIMSEAMT